jgi:hypothetical protein
VSVHPSWFDASRAPPAREPALFGG